MPYTFAIALPPECEPTEKPKAIVNVFSTNVYESVDDAASSAEALVGDVDVLAYWPDGHYQITLIDVDDRTECEHLEVELTECIIDTALCEEGASSDE